MFVLVMFTYLFFEGSILLGKFVNLAFEALHLILLLKAALEGTFPVLKESPLALGEVSSLDLTFDFGKFQCGRSFRQTHRGRVVGKGIKILVLHVVIVDFFILLIKIVAITWFHRCHHMFLTLVISLTEYTLLCFLSLLHQVVGRVNLGFFLGQTLSSLLFEMPRLLIILIHWYYSFFFV